MSTYQINLDRIYKDQVNAQSYLKNLVLEKIEKYKNSKEELHCICRSSKVAANMSDKFVSISYTGTKGRYGLVVRYYLYRKASTETVQEVKLHRGKLCVNGNKVNIGVSDLLFLRSWDKYKEVEQELIDLFFELLPLRNGDKLRLNDLDILMNRLMDEYSANWNMLMDAMFEFNKVGGKYTSYYKLLVRFRLYIKNKDDFKALGTIHYHRVSGGNYADGSRYTQRIKQLKDNKDRIRLTREDIRKAKLGRFTKEYMENSKIIETIFIKHLILKRMSISLQRITSKWQH